MNADGQDYAGELILEKSLTHLPQNVLQALHSLK